MRRLRLREDAPARGEEEGRWLCVLCEESFDAPPGIKPQGCPKGHTAEDFKAS